MNIAVATVSLHLPAASSLKDKRGVVQSLMARLRDRYNVAVAEVANQESHRSSQLGFCTVNTSYVQAAETVQSAVRFMQDELIGKGEIVAVWQEVLGGFGDEPEQQ